MVANPLLPLRAALALMVSLPFLNPVHVRPITTFYEETLALGLGLAALACAGLSRGVVFRVPRLALWIAALGGFVLIQALVIQPAYAELPQIAALYLLWAAVVMCLGATLAASTPGEGAQRVIAAAILSAAVLSVLLPAHGAGGFLNHSNLQGNFLVAGLACAAYLWHVGRLAGWLALGVAIVLGAGLALSGSRASLLELAWLAGWLWYCGGRAGGVPRSRVLIALAVVVAAILAAALLAPEGSARLANRVSRMGVGTQYSYRLQEWEAAIRAWPRSPWLGVGAGGFSWAHFTTPTPWIGIVSMRPEINAHNLLLHLLVETGLAGAALAVAGFSGWALRALREFGRQASPARAWAIAIVGIELVHSMVEYPLWQAEFLGLAALALGMSDPRHLVPKHGTLVRAVVAAAAVAGLVLLFSTVRTYEELKAGVSPARSEALRDSLLRPYVDLAIAVSLPLTPEELEAKLAFNGALMRTWPVEAIVQRQIVYLAMAGRDEEAFPLLANMTRLVPETPQQLRSLLARLPDSSVPAASALRAKLNAPSGSGTQ